MQALFSDSAIRTKAWLRLSPSDHTSMHSDYYKKVRELEAAIRRELADEERRKRQHDEAELEQQPRRGGPRRWPQPGARRCAPRRQRAK